MYETNDIKLQFDRDSNGVVTGVTIYQINPNIKTSNVTSTYVR